MVIVRGIGLLVKRDLRKRPGSALALVLLSALAAALINIGYLLATSYAENITVRTQGAPQALAVLPEAPEVEQVVRLLRADPRVEGVETIPSKIEAELKGRTDQVILYDRDAEGSLGRPLVTDRSARPVTDPVQVPAVLAMTGDVALGDPITVTTSQGSASLHVDAFAESVYGGAPSLGWFAFGLPHEDFAALDLPGAHPAVTVQVDAASPPVAAKALDQAIRTAQGGSQGSITPVIATDLDIVTDVATVSSNLIVVVLLALAGLIVIVTAIIMRFLLRNLVVTDIRHLGVLRAAGYTTGRVVAAMLTSSLAVTLLGAATGVGLSYLVMPSIKRSFEAQVGLGWEVPFSPFGLVLACVLLVGVVGAVALAATWKVHRISTVTALRVGIPTHSHQRGRLPLATTRGPLRTLLGLKSAVRQMPQNVVVALTVAVAAFVAVFGLGLSSALLGQPDRAAELLIGEVEDVRVRVAPGVDVAEVEREIRPVPGVSQAYPMTYADTRVEGRQVVLVVSDDPSSGRDRPITEGRMPKHPNEMAIGAPIAEQHNLRVGDTYRLSIGAGEADYLITGIVSTVRNAGYLAFLSTDAVQRADPGFRHTNIAVYATGDRDAVVERISTALGPRALGVTNFHASVNSQLETFLATASVVDIAVVVLTVGVTVIVVALVVSSVLVRGRQEFGILKALGFSDRDLASQVRWGVLPAVGLGAVAGVIGGAVALGPLMSALFGSIGITTFDAGLNPLLTAGVAAGIIALAWVIAWIGTRRIRRISAYALVTD